jgi:hypothetical protein
MIVPAPIAEDKLARDQFTNTFTLNNMVLSIIDAPVPVTRVIVARCEWVVLAYYFHCPTTFPLEILLLNKVFPSR